MTADDRHDVEALAQSAGVSVAFEDAPRTVDEIKAVQTEIWDVKDQLLQAGLRVAGITGSSLDGEHIVVEGSAASSSIDLGTVSTILKSATGEAIPVRLGVSNETAVTRSTDTAAFFAGGYMLSPTSGKVCSTGFSLKISGTQRVLTARHCKYNDYQARDASTHTYGSGVVTGANGQARALSKSGAGRMFDGAWNNSTGFNKPVDGLRDVGLNTLVCTSGGNSGIHCNIKVVYMNYSFDDGYGSELNIRGVRQESGIAVIQGDSGGPVLIPYSDGSVGAVGMIQGLPNGTTNGCGSAHDLGDNECSKSVLFTSERTIVNSISGASLLTQ